MSERKGNKVELQTFLNWKKPEIGFVVVEISKKSYVTKIWCKLCAKNSEKIKQRSSCKGSVKKSVEAFIIGTNVVTKYQVDRHLSGEIHKIAVCEEGKLPENVSQIRVLRLDGKTYKHVFICLFFSVYIFKCGLSL